MKSAQESNHEVSWDLNLFSTQYLNDEDCEVHDNLETWCKWFLVTYSD